MAGLIAPVARLIDELSKLPGVGPKTAQRLTYHILRGPRRRRAIAGRGARRDEGPSLLRGLLQHRRGRPVRHLFIRLRATALVCVVEEPLDVLAIERTGQYKGRYHVLHGAISPVNGVRPDDLKIAQLVQRVRAGGIEELILATNPNLEGEATSMYVAQMLAGNGVRVTRLARGLPMGGDLEYADEVTVSRALEGRRALEPAARALPGSRAPSGGRPRARRGGSRPTTARGSSSCREVLRRALVLRVGAAKADQRCERFHDSPL